MDNSAEETEFQKAIYIDDEEILHLMNQSINESELNVDSDEEREANDSGTWYYDPENNNTCIPAPILDWDEYYNSEDWDDYESFNRQVQLERTWQKVEEAEEAEEADESLSNKENLHGESDVDNSDETTKGKCN